LLFVDNGRYNSYGRVFVLICQISSHQCSLDDIDHRDVGRVTVDLDASKVTRARLNILKECLHMPGKLHILCSQVITYMSMFVFPTGRGFRYENWEPGVNYAFWYFMSTID
jgi:hypothetical protein